MSYQLNTRKATERRHALEGEFWEPAPHGWTAPSNQTHRHHFNPDDGWPAWKVALAIVGVIAVIAVASTWDYWGL